MVTAAATGCRGVEEGWHPGRSGAHDWEDSTEGEGGVDYWIKSLEAVIGNTYDQSRPLFINMTKQTASASTQFCRLAIAWVYSSGRASGGVSPRDDGNTPHVWGHRRPIVPYHLPRA